MSGSGNAIGTIFSGIGSSALSAYTGSKSSSDSSSLGIGSTHGYSEGYDYNQSGGVTDAWSREGDWGSDYQEYYGEDTPYSQEQLEGQAEMYSRVSDLMGYNMPEVESAKDIVATWSPALKEAFATSLEHKQAYQNTKKYGRDVMTGKYLDPEQNTALANYVDLAMSKSFAPTNALASKYGAYGGSDLALEKGRLAREIAAQTYMSERDKQQQLSSTLLPTLQAYKQNIKNAKLMKGMARQKRKQELLDAERYLLKYPVQQKIDMLSWASPILSQRTATKQKGTQKKDWWKEGWDQSQTGYYNWSEKTGKDESWNEYADQTTTSTDSGK